MTRHLRCVAWVAFAASLGLGWTAYAQDIGAPVAHAAAIDPTASLFVELVKGGGLPAVLALAAWQARGVLGGGIPIEVRLSEEDRKRIDRFVDVLDRRGKQVATALDNPDSGDRSDEDKAPGRRS